jgi:NitT/TauT family transport system permease protein
VKVVDVVTLFLACLASFGRMLTAYIISLIIAIVLGISMARKKYVEAILMPILDVLQSIPILGFFPIAIVLFLIFLPKNIGLELASIFLITTSLVWNMIFGVYSAIKSLDPEVFTMADVYKMKRFSKLAYIYVPVAKVAIVANSVISWAGGWFFLTSAEIMASGSEEHKLFGIGSLIIDFYSSGKTTEFYIAIVLLFIIIMMSYIMIFNPATNTVLQQHILLAFDKIFYYIYKLISILWGFIVSIGIKIESRRTSFHLATLAIPVIALSYSLRSNITNLYYLFLLEFIKNFLLSLGRVVFVVITSFILTIGIAYLAIVRRWGSSIVFIGEILASIPAILWWPLLSPFVVSLPWLVSFIVFLQGSLWYEFFNVILFGVPKIRVEVLDLAKIYRIRGFSYFKYILIPSLMPSIASGALSAWGGAWNASIVAEYFESSGRIVDLGGVGSMLSRYTYSGSYGYVLFTVLLWALMIAILNKVFWSRVFKLVEKTFIVE